MRILHYSLGFPPYRTGGLIKFCMDVMIQQFRMGHQVALLWPGQIRLLQSRTVIKQRKTIIINGAHITNLEIINPLPIPYDEGITNIKYFIHDGDLGAYKEFLERFRPDVIHIHTLMGLHKVFISAAKEMGIRIVFSAHDFFPICPKVTMFRNGKTCDRINDCSVCASCNATALSMKKIIFLQSVPYRLMKNTMVVKFLRNHHRNKYLSEKSKKDTRIKRVGTAEDYLMLRKYYWSILQIIDKIHYNSTVTRRVYEDRLALTDGVVIPISHLDIADRRMKKDFSCEKLRIRYLGPAGCAKGFFLLKDALDKLWKKRRDFRLDVHFSFHEVPPYINEHGRYTQKDLKYMFEDTDVLVVPSIWYETFGFTVLEALSYGVPVIISGTVGARDILADGAGIIIEDITADKLCKAIDSITADKLCEMNKAILCRQQIINMSDVCVLIERKCYG